MATDILVPTLGESVSEATVARWFKQPGEAVKADEPLVELETDKVTLEVNAPAAGVLGDIVARDGETVTVGALLGSIEAGASAGAAKPAGKPQAAQPKAATPKPAAEVKPAGNPEAGAPKSAEPAAPAAGAGSTQVVVPTLGESVSEATVARWLKKPGEAVKADEPLVELETDKVTLEVNAPAAGVLGEIVAKDGETVGVGALLAHIAGAGAAPSTEPRAAAPKPAEPKPAEPKPAEKAPTERPPAPSAAKLARESGIDLSGVTGSGRQGQVLKEDVQALAAAPRPAPPVPAPRTEAPAAPRPAEEGAREERVRMSKLRLTIARRLKEAQNTAAMLTTFNEVDMSGVMALRAKYKDVFEKKHGAKLGFMGLFVKACVGALKEIPAVNAEIDGGDLVFKNYYHIGIAVGTEKGLVVPVVRDADALGLADIEKAIANFGKRARDGQLSIGEMQGGTFTITNGGIYGSLMSTPILNAPQSGILGMHKIQERPVVVGGKVEVRPMMYLALSYDHRIVDGREAVTFLVRVKDALEDPARLMLDV